MNCGGNAYCMPLCSRSSVKSVANEPALPSRAIWTDARVQPPRHRLRAFLRAIGCEPADLRLFRSTVSKRLSDGVSRRGARARRRAGGRGSIGLSAYVGGAGVAPHLRVVEMV